MLGKGNAKPGVCISNLLNIIRTEVPYNRMKGLSYEHIDKVSGQVSALLRVDANWLVKTYEPRVNLNSLNIKSISSQNGDFTLAADLGIKEMIE